MPQEPSLTPSPTPIRSATPAASRPTVGRERAADTEALNLRELLAVIRRNWWVVVGIAGLILGLSSYLAITTPVTYRAKGVIKLANSRRAITAGLSNDNSESAVGLYSDPLKSQIEVLTSRTVAGAVVDSEPTLLRVRAPSLPPSLIRVLNISSEGAIDSVQVDFGPADVTARLAERTVRAAYSEPLQLPGVTFSIAARPSISSAVFAIIARDAAVGLLGANTKATQRPESDVIDVLYTGTEAQPAKAIVNRLLHVFTAMSAASAHQRSHQRRDFIQHQLAENDSLEAVAQSVLSDFRVREHMFSGKEKFSDGQRDAVSIELQRSTLSSEREVARTLLGGITAAREVDRSRALRTFVTTQGITANVVVTQLYDQLVRLRGARDSMTTGRFSSALTNPDVQRLDSLISTGETQLAEAVQSHIRSLDGRLTGLDQARARTVASLDRLPGASAEELRLSSRVESVQKVGAQLREELQKAKIAEAVEGGEVEIVDLATAAQPIATGRVPKIFIGLLVGLLLGVGAAFVREHLDTTIKRREEVERLLQLASVGVIPAIDNNFNRRRRAAAEKRAHRTPEDGKPPATAVSSKPEKAHKFSRTEQRDAIRASLGIEAFASLRTNILYQPNGTSIRTVVVTSCAPKDGKSTVSANIAEAYARSGTRVLLIDCDLRRPRLHEVFDEMVEVGLSDVLQGTVSLEVAMRPVPGTKSLSLLTAGSRVNHPSELLGSDEMRELLDSLREKFDLIVIDSPPVLVVADAALLATRTDGVLFVIRAGCTEPDAARAAVGQLQAVGANIIGAVLNDPDDTLPRYEGEYYYIYQDQYFSTARS